jgi:deoxyribonuclease (pyrimidine dimer)
MTRINASIEPEELPSKLLLAELREVKRIPNVIKSGRYSMNGQPKQFTLNKGHVKFFYNKNGYLLSRYTKLRLEALKRGFNVQDFSGAWDGLPTELMNDWNETKQARELIIERIKERGFKLLEL